MIGGGRGWSGRVVKAQCVFTLREWSLNTGRGATKQEGGGGATKREGGGLQNGRRGGGAREVLPLRKGGGAEKVLAILKGGGGSHKKFWGRFYAIA